MTKLVFDGAALLRHRTYPKKGPPVRMPYLHKQLVALGHKVSLSRMYRLEDGLGDLDRPAVKSLARLLGCRARLLLKNPDEVSP